MCVPVTKVQRVIFQLPTYRGSHHSTGDHHVLLLLLTIGALFVTARRPTTLSPSALTLTT